MEKNGKEYFVFFKLFKECVTDKASPIMWRIGAGIIIFFIALICDPIDAFFKFFDAEYDE
ncbi:MAG: hypothetical protein E7005_07345 [Alphaproteobacteria bacterium]|nr:hypothetical protein [Alphaproteobacteria bacterium]